MRQGKYKNAKQLAETCRVFAVQGVLANEFLLAEVAATLARLAPNYVDDDVQQQCVQSDGGRV